MQEQSNRLRLLRQVNNEVNKSVTYKTDLAQYKNIDLWSIPDTRYGDCEDYALLKRQILITKGFDPLELKMTICKTEEGEGHAVLSVDVGPETYILDNRFKDLQTYHGLLRRGYKFISRQRGKEWVSIK